MRAAALTTVLCDADGNLFPSEEPAFEASVEVTNELLAHVGRPERYTAEQLRRTTTGKNFRTTAADLTGDSLSPADLQRWVDEERRRVSAHLATALTPDPDVLDPLRRLAQRWRLAAVSSSALARLDACFAVTGLAGLLPADRRFSAEDSLPVPVSKPDPAVYLHACSALGIDPGQAVAVEDSVPGVASAVAAGIRTIGNLQLVPLDERHDREQELATAGASVVVASWSEVEAVLSEAG